VAPEDHLLAGLLGQELSGRLEQEHRDNGVTLHLGQQVSALSEGTVTLEDGTEVSGDLIVVGIGVEPRVELAQDAGFDIDDGIVVDADYHPLRGGSPVRNVIAIGDVARRQDAPRIEHWAMALRDGQVAADGVLGLQGAEYGAPFFWTAQHDMSFRYVGHASDPDEFVVDGDVKQDDATVKVMKDGEVQAVITIGRDGAALDAEVALEDGDQERLRSL
jgi:NADPH-dependent 2,4-dienoyl-CoA reductase/sulfur reductase-like enzyme